METPGDEAPPLEIVAEAKGMPWRDVTAHVMAKAGVRVVEVTSQDAKRFARCGFEAVAVTDPERIDVMRIELRARHPDPEQAEEPAGE
jgi:hypothetical protein